MSWSSKLQAAAVLLSAAVLPAFAEIPQSQRDVLKALYASTDGDNWVNNTGWDVNDDTSVVCPGTVPGTSAGVTESPWFGVFCFRNLANSDPDPHYVVAINLPDNNLSGPLPALGNLTLLRNFIAYSTNGGTSHLTSLPPDLASLTTLRNFSVAGNGQGLVGTLPPSLSAFTILETFRVNHNGLTGNLPTLAGAPVLREFRVSNNRLSGPLPALTGLSTLTLFRAEANQLTGSLPNATLNSDNVPALVDYEVHDNQLTGSLPALTGLTNLQTFSAGFNQISGTIPSISHLSSLVIYGVRYNQLSGNLPVLTGLNNLLRFRADRNQLTGAMPAQVAPNLQIFQVGFNQLTGAPPAAPASLLPGESNLCFNNLSKPYPASAAWDTATGSTPWSRACDIAVAPVPTLDQWALMLLGLMLVGMVALRRGGRA